MRNKKLSLLLLILFIGITAFIYFQGNFVIVKYYYWSGFIKQRQGNLKEAIIDFDKATELDKDYPTAYISRGSAYLDLKDYKSAILNYSKAIQLMPNDEQSYAYRGRAYYEINKSSKSMIDYNKAIKLNPKFGYAYLNRALLRYTVIHDYAGGCSDLKIAKKLGEQEAEEHLSLGICD